ncbi:hypothetical protein D1872_263100 [compost metagenome]
MHHVAHEEIFRLHLLFERVDRLFEGGSDFTNLVVSIVFDLQIEVTLCELLHLFVELFER